MMTSTLFPPLSRREWVPLHSNDYVQIIAPSSKTGNPVKDIKIVKNFLESLGLQVKVSNCIFGVDERYPNLAHTDEFRLEDLQKALFDPEVKAIWCIRGGYGAIRLLKFLKLLKLPADYPAKLFIGFSDITLLHLYLQKVWHWNTLHGPHALQVARGEVAPEDIETLRQIMFGEIQYTEISDLAPLNECAKQDRLMSATQIIGGNFTVLRLTFGVLDIDITKDLRNKILLIEEVGEAWRKIDGPLQQLGLTEAFIKSEQRPAAVMIGSIQSAAATNAMPRESMEGKDLSLDQREINGSIAEFAEALNKKNIPLLQCVNIGHGFSNHPVPLGSEATLHLGEKPRLVIKTGACFSRQQLLDESLSHARPGLFTSSTSSNSVATETMLIKR